MKNRIITLAAVMAVGIPTLAACGSSVDSTQTDTTTTVQVETESTTTGTDTTTTSSEATTAASDTTTSTGEVNPYAWLGLQDMPKCNYLDILSKGRYIQELEYHALGVTMDKTEAVDGVNSFSKDKNTTSYSVDGKVISINEGSKFYMEYDMGDLSETAKEQLETAMKEGKNTSGRNFAGTGKGTIPTIEDDKTEYEYYEYNNPESEEAGTTMTERFYMKDGDVYAIYEKINIGASDVESVQIIKSISGDVPADTFKIPDLSGYQKYE